MPDANSILYVFQFHGTTVISHLPEGYGEMKSIAGDMFSMTNSSGMQKVFMLSRRDEVKMVPILDKQLEGLPFRESQDAWYKINNVENIVTSGDGTKQRCFYQKSKSFSSLPGHFVTSEIHGRNYNFYTADNKLWLTFGEKVFKMYAPANIISVIRNETARIYYPDGNFVNFLNDSNVVFEGKYEEIIASHYGLTSSGKVYYMNSRGFCKVLIQGVRNVVRSSEDRDDFVVIFEDGRVGYVKSSQFDKCKIFDSRLDPGKVLVAFNRFVICILVNPEPRFLHDPIKINEGEVYFFPNVGVPTPFPSPPLLPRIDYIFRDDIYTERDLDIHNFIIDLPLGTDMSSVPYPGLRAIETPHFGLGNLLDFSIPINRESTWFDIIARVDEAFDKYDFFIRMKTYYLKNVLLTENHNILELILDDKEFQEDKRVRLQ